MKKIGLLDQYTGANLGDAAILEAAIQNVRARQPGAEISLFALYPEESKRRHGVPSFPITGFRLRWYSDFSRESEGPKNKEQKPRGRLSSGVKETVKRVAAYIPVIRPWLKRAHRAILWARNAPGNLRAELHHIGQTYRLLKSFDLLVISGGGQIDDDYGGPWGHPYTLYKFAVLARATKTELVYWSVGVCALRSRLSEFFVKGALLRASYRSYRDAGSKELLRKLDFTKNDPIVPDLAFSYSQEDIGVGASRARNRPVVGVSPIGYLSHNWPNRDLEAFEAYRGEFIEFVAALALHCSVVLFSTDDMDHPVTKEVFEALATDHRAEVRRNVAKAETATLDSLVDCLSSVDYVVASRLHGVLLSHVFGKPVLAISYERKVDAHMAQLEQMCYRVDFRQPNATAWLDVFAALTRDRQAIEDQIMRSRNESQAKLSKQYDQVLGL